MAGSDYPGCLLEFLRDAKSYQNGFENTFFGIQSCNERVILKWTADAFTAYFLVPSS